MDTNFMQSECATVYCRISGNLRYAVLSTESIYAGEIKNIK